jgi:hypothetical protein
VTEKPKKVIKVNPPEKLLKLAYEIFDTIKTQLAEGNIEGAEKTQRWEDGLRPSATLSMTR